MSDAFDAAATALLARDYAAFDREMTRFRQLNPREPARANNAPGR
jgi:hypothetical protein